MDQQKIRHRVFTFIDQLSIVLTTIPSLSLSGLYPISEKVFKTVE